MINYKHKGNNQQRFLYEKPEHPLSLKQRIPCRQTSRHKKSLIANNIKNKIKMKENEETHYNDNKIENIYFHNLHNPEYIQHHNSLTCKIKYLIYRMECLLRKI